MKKIIMSASLALMTMSMAAQERVSLANHIAIQRQKMERATTPLTGSVARMNKAKGKTAALPDRMLAIAQLADGITESDLKAQGVSIVRTMGKFVIIATTLDDAERVASLSLFKSLEFERKIQQKMCYAREATHVNDLHKGVGLTQAYTGKGVVCGIVDNGFDLNHVNFLDADGNPRVKYFETVGTNSNATSLDDYFVFKTYNTPELIKKFTTDNSSSYHGTHTMGIMAGGYRGNAKVATIAEKDGQYVTSVNENASNPYYGMAYDADIIAGASTNMSNLEIAQAVYDLAMYQEYSKQPVVINLSLGSNSGPHDGTSSECQLYDMLAKQCGAKIVIASGNEGDSKLALSKNLADKDTVMQSFLKGVDIQDAQNGNYYIRLGGVDIYSSDDRPFKEVDIIIFNTSRQRVTKIIKLTPSDDNKNTAKYYCSAGYTDYVGGVKDDTFGKYFEGYAGLGWSVDANSNRAYAMIDIAAINNEANNKNNQYVIGFRVIGEKGQTFHAYAYGDGIYGIDNYGINGYEDGSYNGTVSDMATGHNTLCVGSYTEINGWPQLDGYTYGQFNDDSTPVLASGKVSSFTSYGTLADGRNLPHVLGPGAYVISSMNRYYLENAGYSGQEDLLSAVALNDNRDPYGWSAGTSMACPAVTGIIALWLEADPTLTMDDIKDIIATTSHKTDDMVIDDPIQLGHGLIDAYAGLKEVLRRMDPAGIRDISFDNSRLVTKACGNRRVKVFVAGEDALDIEVFDMAGNRIMKSYADGDEATIDLSGKAKGTYVIRVNGRLSKCILSADK